MTIRTRTAIRVGALTVGLLAANAVALAAIILF